MGKSPAERGAREVSVARESIPANNERCGEAMYCLSCSLPTTASVSSLADVSCCSWSGGWSTEELDAATSSLDRD